MASDTPSIASIGFPFFDPRVESFRYSSKRTALGHDVVLLHISEFYTEYARDFLRGGALTGDEAAEYWVDAADTERLIRDIDRRQRQLSELLDNGKTLVIFVPEDQRFRRSDKPEAEPVSVLLTLPFPLETEAAEGAGLELRTGEPFAGFWRATGACLEAAAIITEGWANVLLAIRGTDAVVASYGQYGDSETAGLAILLPGNLCLSSDDADHWFTHEHQNRAPARQDHLDFITALLTLIDALRSGSGLVELPPWSARYPLPGENEQADAVAKAELAVERAASRAERTKLKLAGLRRRKVLFTGQGSALEHEVAAALAALGFIVRPGPTGRTDLICDYGGKPVVVEVKGLTKSAGEKDSAQLEKWASEYLSEHGQHPKPVLVVNGWCAKPLASRRDVFPNSMLKYATTREHALVSGVQLLGAWLDAGAHPEKQDEVARSLLDCVGVWDRYSDHSDFIDDVGTGNDSPAKTSAT